MLMPPVRIVHWTSFFLVTLTPDRRHAATFKRSDSSIALLTAAMPRPAALYNRKKWQLIGKSQWCCSANCGHPLHALTYNWTRGMQLANTPPLQSTTLGLHPISIRQTSPPVRGSRHPITAYYSFINLERMKGWVDLVGWLHTEIKCRLRESNPDTSPILVLTGLNAE